LVFKEYEFTKEKDMRINKKRITGVAVLLIAGLIFNSCQLITLEQPESEPEIFEPTTIPGSISIFNDAFHGGNTKNWSAVSFTLAGLGGLQDCRLDDTIEINVDGTYSYDGGDTLCGSEDTQQVRTGTWKVINEGANILFDEDTQREYTATVNGFDQNTLSISGQYIGLSIKGIYTSN